MKLHRRAEFFQIILRQFSVTIVFLLVGCVTPAIVLSQASIGVSRPLLKSGSQGAEVTELQAALKLLGYFDGTVDGLFGETTGSAVSRFQQAAGLDSDGIVGSDTWNRLFPPSEATATSPRFEESAPKVPDAQPAPRATPATTTTSIPILRKGMTGPAVRLLQERLSVIGVYDGEADGIFGAGTEAAVQAAQQKYQLEPDGIVGPATWSALMR